MTAQLPSRVYRIGNPENDEHHFTDQKEHADTAKKNGYEVSEYVLAAHEQEPVAWVMKEDMSDINILSTPAYPSFSDAVSKTVGELIPLYTRAAPSIPAAVPTFEEWCASTDQKPLGWVRDAMKEAYEGCRAAMLQSEPVIQPYKLPDGYCVMPCKLSAENGAKCALSGEFHVTHRIVCQSCGGEGCEDCNEEGGWDGEILIGWDIIKQIHEASVEACALPAAPKV